MKRIAARETARLLGLRPVAGGAPEGRIIVQAAKAHARAQAKVRALRRQLRKAVDAERAARRDLTRYLQGLDAVEMPEKGDLA